jgi:hypothetical protein
MMRMISKGMKEREIRRKTREAIPAFADIW